MDVHGHVSTKYDACVTGWTRKRKLVTTPKLPPPPPRQAQYRSAWRDRSHVRTRPSAVTIVSARTLSAVVPSLREAKPTPPPSASPPTPTVGHEPAGIVPPAFASRS